MRLKSCRSTPELPAPPRQEAITRQRGCQGARGRCRWRQNVADSSPVGHRCHVSMIAGETSDRLRWIVDPAPAGSGSARVALSSPAGLTDRASSEQIQPTQHLDDCGQRNRDKDDADHPRQPRSPELSHAGIIRRESTKGPAPAVDTGPRHTWRWLPEASCRAGNSARWRAADIVAASKTMRRPKAGSTVSRPSARGAPTAVFGIVPAL